MCLRSLGTSLPWHLGPLLNQCFNYVTAAHAEVTCAKNAQDALKVPYSCPASNPH
jgi:hypothetical protein